MVHSPVKENGNDKYIRGLPICQLTQVCHRHFERGGHREESNTVCLSKLEFELVSLTSVVGQSDAFFTTKNVNCHRGLGLSSASGILRSLGGYISAGPGHQRGTVFKIYLPAGGKRGNTAGKTKGASRSSSRNQVIHLGINNKQSVVKYH